MRRLRKRRTGFAPKGRRLGHRRKVRLYAVAHNGFGSANGGSKAGAAAILGEHGVLPLLAAKRLSTAGRKSTQTGLECSGLSGCVPTTSQRKAPIGDASVRCRTW